MTSLIWNCTVYSYSKFLLWTKHWGSVGLKMFKLTMKTSYVEHYSCTTRALLVHYSCTTRALLVHYSCTTRALLVHYSCTARALLVHYSCTARALLVHCSCTARALLVHCSCTARALLVHYSCTTRALLVHYLHCMFVTNCTGGRSFSKRNHILNHIWNMMGQERLSSLLRRSIENELPHSSDFKDIIDLWMKRLEKAF